MYGFKTHKITSVVVRYLGIRYVTHSLYRKKSRQTRASFCQKRYKYPFLRTYMQNTRKNAIIVNNMGEIGKKQDDYRSKRRGEPPPKSKGKTVNEPMRLYAPSSL